MLVTFKTKAAGNVLMYKEHAQLILDLLGKDVEQGIIAPEDMPKALEILEAEIARQKKKDAEAQAIVDAEEREKWDDDDDWEEKKSPFEQPVSFSARAFPFLKMLQAANKKQREIVWGV